MIKRVARWKLGVYDRFQMENVREMLRFFRSMWGCVTDFRALC